MVSIQAYEIQEEGCYEKHVQRKAKRKNLSLRADMEILETLSTVERDTSDLTAVETIRKEYVFGTLKLPTASMAQLLVLFDAKLVTFEKSDV